MNEKEFVQWLRGFLEGIHHYNITPAQLDLLKDKLSEVKIKKSLYEYSISSISDYWTRNTTVT